MIFGCRFGKKHISFITEFIIIFGMVASLSRMYPAVGAFTWGVFLGY
jgi:hypothetical protein